LYLIKICSETRFLGDRSHFIEAMGRTEKRAVKSQLIRLMLHIIKWKCQPEKRSASWTISIRSARREIQGQSNN
jgi:hypothetical protein